MLDRETLLEIARRDADPALTITMPTHRTMPEAQQDPIRFRNLLERAREKLAVYGVDDVGAAGLLARAGALIDDADFWQHQDDGLAIFSDPESFQVEQVAVPLPEYVGVGRGYAIRPLLPLLRADRAFYVLAAAWENVRLFKCDGRRIEAVEHAEMPDTIARLEAITEIGNRIDFHPAGAPQAAHGQPMARFHGLGTAPPEEKEKLRDQFAAGLAKAADELLGQMPGTGLVLIADERLSGMFAKHAGARVIRSPKTQVSPAGLSEDALHAIAREAFDTAHDDGTRAPIKSLHAYLQDAGSQRATTIIDDIALAVVTGRVADLFVDPEADIPGRLDTASGRVDTSGSGDLVDALARFTLRQGGDVHAVAGSDLPDGACIAALFRY